ncbi:MAG TPA: aminodeoxychorismate/anthranilate synthase component II [Lentimicrobium sp.]|nr:aminodeoxychorismate/anthranilate synthase component II [Lentimicrobium sp.]
MVKVLLIDHHDSFTYNLAALVRCCPDIHLDVQFPEEIKIEKISLYDKIIFSPGPGLPSEYPLMYEILDGYKNNKGILGVCLGHQAIGKYFGGTLINLGEVHHGKVKKLKILTTDAVIYKGIPDNSDIGVYHSWFVERKGLPECLTVTGISEEGIIMSIAHTDYDIQSVQFHPESFITKHGEKMMYNWLKE